FKRELPLLLDVPNYQGVRIHPGNTADDTEGCILVGNLLKDDFITNSRKTFNSLLERMKQTKEITIEIS
ncbi:MAG: DUF5675 family protein, partial [bacterium]